MPKPASLVSSSAVVSHASLKSSSREYCSKFLSSLDRSLHLVEDIESERHGRFMGLIPRKLDGSALALYEALQTVHDQMRRKLHKLQSSERRSEHARQAFKPIARELRSEVEQRLERREKSCSSYSQEDLDRAYEKMLDALRSIERDAMRALQGVQGNRSRVVYVG